MKKNDVLKLLVFPFLIAPGLIACGSTGKTITSINFQYATGNEYVVGEKVHENNNKIVVKYSDGSEDYIKCSDEAITITGDTTTTGKKKGTLTYKKQTLEFDYTVYEENTADVSVDGGVIHGYYNEDKTLNIYKGIPFAAPPINNNRWRAPKDVEPWSGVKNCFHFGPNSYQGQVKNNDYFITNWNGFSEDCLYLNIWAKNDNVKNKPVLIYIHGGGNTTGGASVPIYYGENIAKLDAILVSINYRLGVFGFLSTDELIAENEGSGSFAILDIIKSISWVKNNIDKFGGDPNNICIMGQSAGAANVGAVLASPLAVGLFQKAMICSGNPIGGDIASWNNQTAKEKADSTNNKENKTIAELRALPTSEVSKYINNYTSRSCIDGYVLDKSIPEAILSGRNKDVIVTIGNVTGDTSLGDGVKDDEGLTGIQKTIGALNVFAQARLKGGATNTYTYYYDYIQNGADKAYHTDDITFWLGNNTNYYGEFSAQDKAKSASLSAKLVNYLKTGLFCEDWLLSSGDYGYYHIGNVDQMDKLSDATITAYEQMFDAPNYIRTL